MRSSLIIQIVINKTVLLISYPLIYFLTNLLLKTQRVIAHTLYTCSSCTHQSIVVYAPSYKYEQPSNSSVGGTCSIQFSIPMQLKAPIYLYYRLSNFYQNHRKYVKSLNYNQLHGDAISEGEAISSCSPMAVSPDGKIYYPCGLIANSMFNGT